MPCWLRQHRRRPVLTLAQLASHVIHVAVRDNLLGGPEGGDCVRCDGRGQDELRFLQSEVGTLPVVHGSSFFARGDTAALCTITLGPHDPHLDGTDALGNFMLHYEFPPYCVNEVGKVGGVNRRMVGHGNLAMKALRAVLPRAYPFTVRITSEITGSDGSSSMATVCGATLALMDAGVPISAPVAGISVGLVTDGDPLRPPAEVSRSKLLTDIMGLEDHYGDMDFKVRALPALRHWRAHAAALACMRYCGAGGGHASRGHGGAAGREGAHGPRAARRGPRAANAAPADSANPAACARRSCPACRWTSCARACSAPLARAGSCLTTCPPPSRSRGRAAWATPRA